MPKFKVTRSETISDSQGRKWKDIKERLTAYGHEYWRSGYEINDKTSHDINAEHFTSDGPIGVLCGKCHGEFFTLSYGDYEIFAKCKNCGLDSVVYDG